MKVLTTRSAAAKRRIGELLTRRSDTWDRVTPTAKRIVEGVRKGGDKALRRYAQQLDGISPQLQLQIPAEELKAAWDAITPEMRRTLEVAAKNIRAFAQKQKPKDWDFAPVPGVTTGQRVRPLGAVGCYVPSGRYPLPSTLLMTAIPAQVAGVPRIVAVSPKPALETLAAAHLLGITEFYRLGGAHAVSALAYGTESLQKVDKIVGPGNAYVTAAKKLVSFDCAIDMLAGPTEIVVTSDNGTPAGIASDLVAQAEHDPDALAIFLTTRADLAAAVSTEVKQRVRSNVTAREAIQRNGLILVTKSKEEAQELTNALAPEHLTVDSEEDLAWVENAGSVFIGEYSAQPLGDYVSGPNHTLPTGGLARVRGGLSVMDFVKLITVQSYTAKGLAKLGPAGVSLAKAEGLTGHAEAIEVRLATLGKESNA